MPHRRATDAIDEEDILPPPGGERA
jgi:hypothetical protein